MALSAAVGMRMKLLCGETPESLLVLFWEPSLKFYFRIIDLEVWLLPSRGDGAPFDPS